MIKITNDFVFGVNDFATFEDEEKKKKINCRNTQLSCICAQVCADRKLKLNKNDHPKTR